MNKKSFSFLGSIKLAVPLLCAITAILIGATFYESEVGSATVQQAVYKSPWFGALMFLLAINLGVSALSRYPWRGPRKVGFALTHLGLIVIIAGSAAVIHLGLEGLTLLRTDSGPNNQIRVEGELLEVMNPQGQIQQTDVFVKASGKVYPQSFAGLSLLSYSENTMQTASFIPGATVVNPGVRLSLTSDRMGQTVERSLAVAPASYSQMTIGPAQLEIIAVASEAELQKYLNTPQNKDSSPWGDLQIVAGDKELDLDVKTSIGNTSKLANNLKVKVVDFWPDFRLNSNNQPATASQNFNNPAVQLELTTATGTERWFVFGNNFEPIRSLVSGEAIQGIKISYTVQPPTPEDYFRVITTPDKQLFYSAQSSRGFKSGSLEVGQVITPGWADFQITLEEFMPQAQLKRQVVPVDNPNFEGVPALLVGTETGTQTWLPWGEATTINDTAGDIFAAFSPKVLQLPFNIQLEDFIVERNEGSESVAMWTSQIRLQDPQTGLTQQRKVWMNHPTWYQGWKIAQASWNPGDLRQSTLQVKREPAWVTALTWIGSALVVIGIAVMFYGPVLVKKLKPKPALTEQPNPTPTEAQTKPLLTVN